MFLPFKKHSIDMLANELASFYMRETLAVDGLGIRLL